VHCKHTVKAMAPPHQGGAVQEAMRGAGRNCTCKGMYGRVVQGADRSCDGAKPGAWRLDFLSWVSEW
jgi:hypothetical protein